MIVTCPACATRYLIDPRTLGAAGRSVRCTQCDHVWAQEPPEDAPRRVDLPVPGTDKPQAARVPAPLPAAAVEATPLPPEPTPSPPRPFVDTADPTVARGGNRPLVVVAVAAVVLAALWFGRDAIVDTVPALQSVYATFGVTAGDLSTELEIRDVTSNRHQENGHATLVIDGEVANLSGGSRRVPPVRITLQDSSRHAIRSWTVVATRDPLMPGETVPFHSAVADPAAAAGASVSFDDGGD